MQGRHDPSGDIPRFGMPADFDDPKLRAVRPDLWNWFETQCPRHKQPGRAALTLALIRRLSWKKALAPEPWPPALPALSQEQEREREASHAAYHASSLNRLEAEISELLGWLVPPITDDQRKVAVVRFSWDLKNAGVNDEEIAQAIQIVSHRRRGRPVDMHLVWLRAWDLRLLDPREWIWRKLPNAVCPCTKRGGHDESCVQAIRQGVMQAQKVAAKYRVDSYALEIALEARPGNSRSRVAPK
jgi:hypothetical protein